MQRKKNSVVSRAKSPASLLALALTVAPCAAQPVDAAASAAEGSAGRVAVLTLARALERALQRSAAVVSAAAERDVAAARLRSARAWANPTLAVDADNVLGSGAFSNFDAAETTLSLSQELPLGGRRSAGLRGARAGLDLAAAISQLAVLVVRRDVTVAYAEAVAAERLAEIERERARIATETRAAVEKRFNAGLESELQRSRVAVATSGLQAAARRAAAQAMVRRRALAGLWREDAVTEPLDVVWFDTLTPPAIAAAAAPLQLHPRLRVAQLRAVQAQATLDAARAQRYSGIEATVGTRSFKGQPDGSNRAFVIGLSMPLPLWDRNAAGIAEARAAQTHAELEAERVVRDLQGDRATAVAELEAATLEATALADSGLPAAQSAARLAQQGYEAGRLSLLERLDAERALSDVREHLERARLAVQRSRAELQSLQLPQVS